MYETPAEKKKKIRLVDPNERFVTSFYLRCTVRVVPFFFLLCVDAMKERQGEKKRVFFPFFF